MKWIVAGPLAVGTALASVVTAGAVPLAPVRATPVITRQPTNVDVRLGTRATFAVRATGSPTPDYRWQVSASGGPFADTGTDSPTLSVVAGLTDDDATYRVIVSNGSGSVTSDAATLRIGTSRAAEHLKPLIAGLVDKGTEGPYHRDQPYPPTTVDDLAGYGAAFAGTVVDATWAQLEPSPGTYDFGVIDQSLANVAAHDAADPGEPLTVKFRIWSGFDAPAWAKSLDGPPVPVPSGADQPTTATLGRYWLADYEQQWTDLQAALGRRYDANPLVSEVAVTSCSTITAEPLVSSGAIEAALEGAGWTAADQIRCVDHALADYGPWRHTGVDFTFNDPGPAFTSAVSALLSTCASSELTGAGPVCILDNHGLTDTVTPRQSALYAEMDDLWRRFGGHVPVDLQTVGPGGFDLCSAIAVAVGQHARSVEVWPAGAGSEGFTQYRPAQLAAWDHALVAGTPPSCS
jgi:hypothetical protein